MIYQVVVDGKIVVKCTDHTTYSHVLPGAEYGLASEVEYAVPIGWPITAADDHMRTDHIALAANAA